MEAFTIYTLFKLVIYTIHVKVCHGPHLQPIQSNLELRIDNCSSMISASQCEYQGSKQKQTDHFIYSIWVKQNDNVSANKHKTGSMRTNSAIQASLISHII